MDLRRTLFLVPTEIELHRLLAAGGRELADYRFELCGFGPVASAILASKVIDAGMWESVVLCGIAGAYPSSGLSVGQVVTASDVMLDGVGLMIDGQLQSGQTVGFRPFLPDQIMVTHATSGLARCGRLLTVCIASNDHGVALARERRYGAVMEDMEGYAVAVACQQQNLGLTILRGISNIAGDTDKSRWSIDAALGAVAAWIHQQLE